MGMFDYVRAVGPQFVCSRGHDLQAEEFQTKDFGCEMASIHIELGQPVTAKGGCFSDGDMKIGTPTLYAYVYTNCPHCPCFVQRGTGNIADVDCEFRCHVRDGVVTEIVRTSSDTEAQLEATPKEKWMAGCLGPMSRAEAEIASNEEWHT